MKPCSITTMSRLKPRTSKLTSAPPWNSAPNSTLASTMPTGWLRPISATAMPVKPAPLMKSSSNLPFTPAISFMPTNPASAPDRLIETMICRCGLMPA